MFSTLLRGVSGRFDPFVVCDSTGAMIDSYRALASDLVSTPMNAPGHVGATRVIAAAIDRWSIDLVHTHLWNADLFGGVAAAWRGVPSVSTVHGSNFLPFGVTGPPSSAASGPVAGVPRGVSALRSRAGTFSGAADRSRGAPGNPRAAEPRDGRSQRD